MKKTFLILITLVMMSVNVFADGLTATLQQGDKMTPYYGVDAFKNAYEAAEDGAVITLSAGTFNTVNSIKKSIKIVGNFGLNDSSMERTILSSLAINANKVTIDGINFTGDVTLGNINDCNISHSWVNGTLKYDSTTSWHINTVVDQCVVKTETAIKQSKNYTIKNSTIKRFSEFNSSSNIAYISNCVIYYFYEKTDIPSGYVQLLNIDCPIAIYKNNIIGLRLTDFLHQESSTGSTMNYRYRIQLRSPSEFYFNIFTNNAYKATSLVNDAVSTTTPSDIVSFAAGCFNEGNSTGTWSSILTSYKYPSTPQNPGNGQDGTIRGPQGGTGFSLYPNIPRITSSTIDSNTDSDGKLNVTINVSIPQ